MIQYSVLYQNDKDLNNLHCLGLIYDQLLIIKKNRMIELFNIELKFKNLNPKLKLSFPNDPQADLQIIFKRSKFNLQRVFLTDQSQYFKNEVDQSKALLEIKQDLNEQAFKKVLSTFYGNVIEVDRGEIDKYTKVVKILKIESFQRCLRSDIFKHICSYDIFILLKMAQQNQDQELFSACFDLLQKESYMQLQLNQHQLISLNLPLFKLVIKGCNHFYSSRNIEQTQQNFNIIVSIIQQYCSAHGYDKEKHEDLLYQLINYKPLTSEQFKEVFLTQSSNETIKKQFLERRLSKISNQNSEESSLKLTNSLHLSIKKSQVSNKKMKLQNIYLKKRVQQLERQVTYLKQQLKHIIKVSAENQQMQKNMQANFRIINKQLKQQLKAKQMSETQNKKIINNFQNMLEKMHDQLDKKTQEIDKIVKNLCQKSGTEFAEEDFYSYTKKDYMNEVIVSQFLPASFIAKVISPSSQETLAQKNSKKKVKSVRSQSRKVQSSQQVFDDDEMLQTYLNRISFDHEPISVSKKQLLDLSKFINSEGFLKKQLILQLRRSRKSEQKGNVANLKSQAHLLVFITSDSGERFGFYILKNQEKNLSTKSKVRSFYYNLKSNSKRFIPDIGDWDEAFDDDKYLISWKGELIVPKNFIQEDSYFNNQPSKAYKKTSQKQSQKLSSFKLQCVQIYSITEGQMQMIV